MVSFMFPYPKNATIYESKQIIITFKASYLSIMIERRLCNDLLL